MPANRQGVAGTGDNAAADAQAPPASVFGIPKYSTQRRFVPDNGNEQVGFVQNTGAQVAIPTTRLDQLDVVTGMKIYLDATDTWTEGAGEELSESPFFPAALVQQITFKLQAAYNTYNLTGPLASIIQAYRPLWGSRIPGQTPNQFVAHQAFVDGAPTTIAFGIDIPFAIKFDEYFDLSPLGDPTRKVYDAIVSPMYMAAQARVVVPTITLAPGITVNDRLGGPVSKDPADTTSTFTGTGTAQFLRDAYWTANNPAANPPEYPWMYTRDYFTQPTSGQGKVGVLIQNTGISVGQVMSLFGFVWDPDAAGSLGGALVPFSAIDSFEFVTGGSLQNIKEPPQARRDRMQNLYGLAANDLPDGVFVFDYALSPDGAYLTNEACINTYVVNGVQLNITFVAGSIPGPNSTVYMGVEALKMATS